MTEKTSQLSIASNLIPIIERGAAMVFPGQGAQSSGMGRRVFEHSPAARETYAEASDYLGFDIAKICFEATEEDLASTENTQPAVLTTSFAMYRAAREKFVEFDIGFSPKLFGGHSMGMFSAAVASGSLSFRDSLNLILERARLMGGFSEARPVGMAAIIGLNYEKVKEICEQATVGPDCRVDVANHNEELQTVISGDSTAIEGAMGIAKSFRAKAIRLKLKVSSHTPLHEQQSNEFAAVVRKIKFQNPESPVVSNIGSHLMKTGVEIQSEFENQLKSPVLWADNVRRMVSEGVEMFVEAGPGHALTRMIRRINESSIAVSLDDARDPPIPISALTMDAS